MKTVILNWLQNDGTRGFSKGQLKGKQLSPMFRPDALVVFKDKVKPNQPAFFFASVNMM